MIRRESVSIFNSVLFHLIMCVGALHFVGSIPTISVLSILDRLFNWLNFLIMSDCSNSNPVCGVLRILHHKTTIIGYVALKGTKWWFFGNSLSEERLKLWVRFPPKPINKNTNHPTDALSRNTKEENRMKTEETKNR